MTDTTTSTMGSSDRVTSLSGNSEPCRRILSSADMDMWLHCEGYRDYLNFIKQLNEFAKGVHGTALKSRDEILDPYLVKVVGLLDRLSYMVDEIAPFNDDKNQRFGNKAYRVWFDSMLDTSQAQLEEIFGEKDGAELALYMGDSFGNKVRIDYGTGHEMCFVIFLMGVYKLALIPEALKESSSGDGETLSRSVFQALSHQLLTVFALIYMPLVRKVQLRYRLEPAGSHGAFSLDDFQFLPFYFGSAQMIGHPSLGPGTFPQSTVAERYKDEYIFYAAVAFIHQEDEGGLYLSKVEYRWLHPDGTTFTPSIPDLAGVLLYKMEYHIIYSASYQVPVLYFTIGDQGGKAVSLDWLWRRLPRHLLSPTQQQQHTESTGGEPTEDQLYAFFGQMVTQTMHPISGSPCFSIHPCRTAQLMGQVVACEHCRSLSWSSSGDGSSPVLPCTYLLTWLSSLAPVAGLFLPNEYATSRPEYSLPVATTSAQK